nr:MAG: hypothetical protein ADFBMEEK_00092 [Peromyscus leucopus gammaherpesvirus]
MREIFYISEEVKVRLRRETLAQALLLEYAQCGSPTRHCWTQRGSEGLELISTRACEVCFRPLGHLGLGLCEKVHIGLLTGSIST